MNGPRDYAPPHIRAVNPPGINQQDMQPLPRSLQRAARADGVSEDTLATLAQEVERAGMLNTSLQERQHPDGGPQGWARHPALDVPTIARQPTLLQDLAEILVRLPFGEMVEMAQGIVLETGTGADPEVMKLATQIHAWARKTYDAR